MKLLTALKFSVAILLSTTAFGKEKEIVYSSSSTFYTGASTVFGPANTLSFHNSEGKLVGTLTWEKGILEFHGKADKAAESFFRNFLKEKWDEWWNTVICGSGT